MVVRLADERNRRVPCGMWRIGARGYVNLRIGSGNRSSACCIFEMKPTISATHHTKYQLNGNGRGGRSGSRLQKSKDAVVPGNTGKTPGGRTPFEFYRERVSYGCVYFATTANTSRINGLGQLNGLRQ